MYAMNNKTYNIDEEDLKKLIKNSDVLLVQLKQVMIHPSSIVAIEPYYVEYNADYKNIDGVCKMTCLKPPEKIRDLFKEEVLKLN